MSNERKKVFVYGTLRKGFGNHNGCLAKEDTVSLGNGKTKVKMNMIAHGYPMVTDRYSDENDNFIVGELYEVSDATVKGPLDGLEGHPSFFERVLTPIVMEDGTEEEAWMYYLHHKGANYGSGAVPTGDFKIFKDEQRK